MNYIRETISELKTKVVWTKRNEIQRLTVLVAVFCVLFSLAVWGVDTALSRLIVLFFDFVK